MRRCFGVLKLQFRKFCLFSVKKEKMYVYRYSFLY